MYVYVYFKSYGIWSWGVEYSRGEWLVATSHELSTPLAVNVYVYINKNASVGTEDDDSSAERYPTGVS